MDLNFSAFDGILAVALLIVVVWMALKLVTRLILGLVILVIIAVAFFGLHLSDFDIQLG